MIRAALEALAARLAAEGLDLAAAGSVAGYQAAATAAARPSGAGGGDPAPGQSEVPAEYRLPDFGRPRAAVLLVGNTRALWPRFTAAWRADAGLAAEPDPLDRWVEAAVARAAAGLPCAFELRYSHHPPPRRIAIQRLAHRLGLAHLGPAHLSIHPRHGAWIALRAAVVLDAEWEGPEPPPAPDPCGPCPKPCLAAMERAVLPGAGWEAWLAVRDACPISREARYPEAQVRYHYTKEKRWLRTEP